MDHDTKFLRRWEGGFATLWDYSVSHKMLTIRIERAGVVGNLQIMCGDTIFIHGPTKWSSASLTVQRINNDLTVVKDERAGFEVHSGIVIVAENCKPVNPRPMADES